MFAKSNYLSEEQRIWGFIELKKERREQIDLMNQCIENEIYLNLTSKNHFHTI